MKLIDIKKLSEKTAVKIKTLYSWRASGVIPADCVVSIEGLVRFDERAIEKWLETLSGGYNEDNPNARRSQKGR